MYETVENRVGEGRVTDGIMPLVDGKLPGDDGGALGVAVLEELENPRIGIVHLDRRGRILAVNDRALSLLRQGEWLSDKKGVLQARAPDDQIRPAQLVAEALPTSGAVPVGGSMLLGRVSRFPPFVVHVKPVGVPQPDYGARHVAALVLLVEAGRHPRLDPAVVAKTLGLTPAESQVAVWLADGTPVRDIARVTGLTEGAIYWHLKQIYRKLPISRQCQRSPERASFWTGRRPQHVGVYE